MAGGEPAKCSGSAPGCGYTSFNSSAWVSTSGAFAFGLTHTQSIGAGIGRVPFVSTAMVNPRRFSAVIKDGVDLQQRLAAGQHDQATVCVWPPPPRCGGVSQGPGRGEAIAANEIGVTESADSFGAIHLPPGPEIAAGKADEDGGTADIGTFALHREE